MLESIVSEAPVFLLVASRTFAFILTLPLFSSRNISRIAKLALTGYMAYFIFPQVSLISGSFAPYADYIQSDGSFTLEYVLLLLGEGLIGIVLGFFIQIIFASFSTAGQFFAFQMGFSAAEAYDSLNQVENPLMGQYLNLIAMLIFLQNHWFQELFLGGLVTSFKSLNAFAIVNHSEELMHFMLSGLSSLFVNAFTIALPIMATLFLINVTVGILAKAAPQMNLLSEGFPILMLTSFFVITQLMPYMCEFFTSSFVQGFHQMERLFLRLGGQIL